MADTTDTSDSPSPGPGPSSPASDLESSWKRRMSGLISSTGMADLSLDSLAKSSNLVGTSLVSFGSILTDSLKTVVDLPGEMLEDFKLLRPEINEIRDMLGGISEEMVAQNKLVGLGAIYLDNYESVLRGALSGNDEMFQSSLKLKSGLYENRDLMDMLFSDPEDAARSLMGIMEGLTETLPTIQKKITKENYEGLVGFKKILELSDDEITKLMQRQYAYTGETGTKILEDITNVSVGLAEQAGLSAKSLKNDIVSIVKEVDMFGDIGVDSAGRIASALQQLGVDFETFKGLTSQFMDFETAAQKMGELSSMFGIQMDAMEMTYLANEDQEEFLFRMREEILDAGVDVENMSKTRARALAGQLGMQVDQMKTFLKEGQLEFDQVDMVDASERALEQDALVVGAEKMAVLFNDTNKTSAQISRELQMQQAYQKGIRGEIQATMTNLRDSKLNLKKIKLDEGQQKIFKEGTSAMLTFSTEMSAFTEEVPKFTDEMFSKLSKIAEEGTNAYAEIMSNPDTIKEKIEVSTDNKPLEEILKEQNISASEENKKFLADLEQILTKNNIDMQQNIDKIIATKTESGTTTIKLELDGKVIAEKVAKSGLVTTSPRK